MAAPLLAIERVSMRFGGLVALRDVDLEVEEGEIFGLLGPNGAGKTTLFNVISGLYRPTAGRLLFRGREVTRLPPHRRARHGLARTFQITQPFAELTVEENVMVGALSHCNRLAQAREHARDLVGFVGLENKRHALAKELSTGQRKRLELARAMAIRPRLLLMDEVTGGVDQKSIPGLVELALRLRDSGVTIVMVEHNMGVITRLADRMMFLDRGEALLTGTPHEVMGDERVRSLYLGRQNAAA